MDTTTCPECGAPAAVTDRFVLESTDGPIEHVKVRCAAMHWFLMSTESLARHRAAAAPAAASGPTAAPLRRRAAPPRPRPARRSR
jgi:hypothetical protein